MVGNSRSARRRSNNMTKRVLYLGMIVVGLAVILTVSMTGMRARQAPAGAAAVRIDEDDIGGVVTGPRGPEAGVWVIAETRDLPTRLIKSVVTDDQGRSMLPDLPKGNYDVWVRGYGLVASKTVKEAPGTSLHHTATTAPSH